MGWGAEEAKRKKEQDQRKSAANEAAVVRQKMLPQMLEDTWTELVAQIEGDFRDYSRGGGGEFQCVDQNAKNWSSW